MGYFDEEENKAQDVSDDMSALAEGVMSKEERAAEKARLKEDKLREKELRKLEKMEKKVEKKKAKGLFVGDIEDKMSGLAKPDSSKEAADNQDSAAKSEDTAEPAKASETVAEAAAEAVKDAEAASAAAEQSEAADSEKNTEQSEAIAELSDEEESGRKKKKKEKTGKDGKPKEVNIVRDLLSLIIYIGIVIVICFLIVTYVGRRTLVHGSSMDPTLQDGDSVWVNMLAYRFSDPERYDIIVFPYSDDVNYIKRIIGLPGETIQINSNGDILINGKILQEPKQFARMVTSGVAIEPITLGPDEYFVLGDNRVNSKDSRYPEVGNIKRERIIGKAVFRLTPLKNFGKID